MYEYGKCVPQSDAGAIQLKRADPNNDNSGENGFAPAQNNLGVMYEKGKGVPQDEEEAVRWFD